MIFFKRIWLIFILLNILFLGDSLRAQGVDAYFYASPFYAPGYGVYVETYITINGSSVRYALNENNRLQASLQATMMFKNADEIQEYRKYKIVSLLFEDSLAHFPDFIDLQRILIPEGVYNFDLIIHDNLAADSLPDFKTSQMISVNIPKNEISLSGIQFLDRFTETDKDNIYKKNGYECVPFASDLFDKEVKYLRFYLELYNAAKDLEPLDDFNFFVSIEPQNTHKMLKEFSSFTLQKAMNLNVLLKEIDIRKLPSGNYYLKIEVLDKNNRSVLKESRFFQRNNPGVSASFGPDLKSINTANTFVETIPNIDSLRIAILSLQPIADQAEQKFIKERLATADWVTLKQFFFNFWNTRNQFQPKQEWEHYKELVRFVQNNFGTVQLPGFNTDRGKIYLQYGAPDAILEENSELNAYPYTIWQYFSIADQTNRKFIFYNPDFTPNKYILLHSNMKGELANPQWDSVLYSKEGKDNKPGNAKNVFEGE